ncbi:TonB-dependent receptor [Litorimonas haliclonae]|uniref:TonB-dependent receptor n=1 Tax=Litorimonas haliclonae TaxID=2081977 RepID=UPI0039EF5AE7
MPFKRLGTLASTVALSALSTAAFAQSSDGEIDEVIVTGQASQVELTNEYAGDQVARGGRAGLLGNLDFLDAPFAGTAYTSDLVIAQQSESIGDVLQNDPVVRVAKGFGNFQEVYILRGFPVFSDDITLNGVYGILPRQFVAAELLERVEVFRGANAFINGAAPGGSGAGGTINLVPKRAPADGIRRVTLGFEGDSQYSGAVDLGQRFGEGDNWGVRANGVFRDGEGAIEGQETNLKVLSLGTDYSGPQFRFSADIGYQDNHIDVPRPQVRPLGEIPEPPDASGNYAQPFTFSDEKQLFAAARGEYDLTDSVTAWIGGGFREGEEDNDLSNPRVAADGTLTSSRFVNTREDSIRSIDAGLRAEFDTGSIGHSVVASGTFVDLESKNAFVFADFGGFPAGTLSNPVAFAPPPTDAFIGGDLANPLVTEASQNTSFAIADTLSFAEGRFLATFGLRHQNIETQSFDATSGALSSGYDESKVTPAVGLVWKATSQLSVYGNYAENLQPGATAPNVSGGLPVENGGDVLEPFAGEQIEAGLKYDGGNFGGTLSVFSVNRPNGIVENQIFSADGEQRNKGIELSVFGEPVTGLRVLGGATILDNQLEKTQDGVNEGNTSVGTPEFQGNINVEYDIAALPGLTVDGRVVHTGKQFTNAANSINVDAWTRLDLGVRYSLDVNETPVTLRARLENVTDNDYWASVGGFPGSNYLILGNPRTLSLSASVDF